MNKKFLSIVLAGAMAMAMVACNNSEKPAESKAAESKMAEESKMEKESKPEETKAAAESKRTKRLRMPKPTIKKMTKLFRVAQALTKFRSVKLPIPDRSTLKLFISKLLI